MSGRLAARLVLVAGSLVVTLVLVELALRAVGYEQGPLSIQIEDTADARAFHVFQDDNFTYDPLLIWRPRYGQSVFNRQGFRGPELPSATGDPRVRIFAVGDSNTLGWAGADGANWPLDMQDAVGPLDHDVVVVNAGVWGYASYQGLVRFRETLAFDPDLVLISFGSNDAHQVLQSDRAYAENPIRSTDVGQWVRRFRLGQLVLAAVEGRTGSAVPQLQPRVSLEEYRANLTTIVREARARGVAVALLTRPYIGEIPNARWWKNWGADYHEATADVARAEGVPFIDVYSFFKGRDELFADESHFTEEGHRLAAELILEQLRPVIEGLQ